MEITQTQAGGDVYASPFIGPVDLRRQLNVDVTALTNTVVDSNGYLKPGTPLQYDGTLVDGASQIAGIVVEAQKVAAGNDATSIAAGGTKMVAIATHGNANKKIIEDNLGRVLSANEIAAIGAGHIVLVS